MCWIFFRFRVVLFTAFLILVTLVSTTCGRAVFNYRHAHQPSSACAVCCSLRKSPLLSQEVTNREVRTLANCPGSDTSVPAGLVPSIVSVQKGGGAVIRGWAFASCYLCLCGIFCPPVFPGLPLSPFVFDKLCFVASFFFFIWQISEMIVCGL